MLATGLFRFAQRAPLSWNVFSVTFKWVASTQLSTGWVSHLTSILNHNFNSSWCDRLWSNLNDYMSCFNAGDKGQCWKGPLPIRHGRDMNPPTCHTQTHKHRHTYSRLASLSRCIGSAQVNVANTFSEDFRPISRCFQWQRQPVPLPSRVGICRGVWILRIVRLWLSLFLSFFVLDLNTTSAPL